MYFKNNVFIQDTNTFLCNNQRLLIAESHLDTGPFAQDVQMSKSKHVTPY